MNIETITRKEVEQYIRFDTTKHSDVPEIQARCKQMQEVAEFMEEDTPYPSSWFWSQIHA